MARQYTNFKKYLESNNFVVLTSQDDFKESQEIEFKCQYNHITKLGNGSFINKKSKTKNNPEKMCTGCENNDYNQSRFVDEREKIFSSTGHTLITLDNDRNVTYECGRCGEVNSSHLTSLQRNLGRCGKCSHESTKNDVEEVEKELRELSIKLVEYRNNKCLIVVCTCNNEYTTTLFDIRRGRRCINCKQERTKQTNLEKYGVENTFQAEECKEKTKQTNLEKYGVEHHSQNADVKQKLRETCKEQFGVEFAFCQPHVYEKIRQTHKELHGVEYPLQSEAIQKKIDDVFIEKYGVCRPFYLKEIHEKIKKTMIELYGCDNYTNSEHCKQRMLKLYGSEYYIDSETFHQTMITKYGFPYPAQNPEIFSKMMRSSFSRKDYTFPLTKRTVQVMGYEPRAIDYLLKHKNKFLKRMIDEDEIMVDRDVPTFSYKDDDNRDHIYYPDIYIKDTKLIYEVKSAFVFNYEPRKNYLKFCEVAKKDYVLKVLIFDEKELMDIWTFKKDKKGEVVGKSMVGEKKDITITFDKPLVKKWNKKEYVDIEFIDEEEIKLSEDLIDELCVDIIQDII